jgi:Tol biopolymer transport system component
MVRRRVLPWASGALVTGAIVAGLAAWNLKPGGPPEPRQVVRSTFPLPANVGFRNTGRRVVAIAPDGRRFVYNAAGGLYVRSLDALDAQVIPGTEHSVFTPTFSPDGESIAFTQSGELRRIAVSGGSSLVLATLGEGAPDLSWEPDGTILYVQSDGIWQVSENGGDPQQLVAIEDGRAQGPQRLPGGDWVLYALVRTRPTSIAADDSEIVIASPSSGERRTLRARASHARYVPTGHILYGYNGTLYAAPFDVGRLEFTAAPVPVVEGLRSAIQGGLFHFDISRTGTLVYVPGPAGAAGEEYGIGVADRAGTVTRLVVPPGAYRHVRASRDGKRLAFDSESGNEAIIWIYDLAGASAIRRLTFEGRNRFPVWSPDGERIAFQSDRGGSAAIFVERIDGAGGAQQVTTPNEGEVHIPEDWSPDGNHLSFSVLQERTYTLRFLSLEDGTATQLGSLQSVEPIGSVFSADGKWLAYHAVPRGTSAESASGGVFVEPFPATGARYQVPKVLRDFQPVWSADGPELFYVGSTASGQLAAVRISTESGLSFDGPTFLPFSLTADRLSANTRAFDVLPDGRFVGPATGMSEALVPQVRFVVNWFEELKRLVPTE